VIFISYSRVLKPRAHYFSDLMVLTDVVMP
jgi:hypothetical protein